MASTLVYCSFCGKAHHEVVNMIAGPASVAICNECVECCVVICAGYSTDDAAAAPWFDPKHPMNSPAFAEATARQARGDAEDAVEIPVCVAPPPMEISNIRFDEHAVLRIDLPADAAPPTEPSGRAPLVPKED